MLPTRQQLRLTIQEEIKQSLTLRLFISRACVRRPSSFSPVPILLCSKCSFSSSLRTTCSWASTLERGGTEGLKCTFCRSPELSWKLHAKTISASPSPRSISSACLFLPEHRHTSSLRAVSRPLWWTLKRISGLENCCKALNSSTLVPRMAEYIHRSTITTAKWLPTSLLPPALYNNEPVGHSIQQSWFLTKTGPFEVWCSIPRLISGTFHLVLILSGIQLILFIVAHMVLYFGCAIKAHYCFKTLLNSTYTASRPSLPHAACQRIDWGCTSS